MSPAFATSITRSIRVRRRIVPLVSSSRPVRWYASARSPEDARAAIQSEQIMIFSTSYCPYCAQVKALFNDLKVPYTVWEVDQLSEGQEIRQFLANETGQTTVPNVFVGGKHVGGCDDTMILHQQGKLLDMVNAKS